MMRAVQIRHYGGPEQLVIRELSDPEPGPAEILVRSAVAGVNFIDVYHREGVYEVEPPFVPGMEGAGTVLSVGSDVEFHAVGDRVAWPATLGSYAELVVVPADRAVAVPPGLGLDIAAAAMLQGMTAHYLARSTFPLAQDQRCLIHAGAGGVGQLLIQMAKRAGAVVFTTVGTAEKEEVARRAGAHHVIRYTEHDFVDEVVALAGEHPLDVIYDGVGASTFVRGLDLLRPRGMMVLFGQSSGVVEPFDPGILARKGSLFVTRPTLGDYIADRYSLQTRADDLFAWIADGSLRIDIGGRWTLDESADAHRALQARLTTGKIILEPS